MRVQSSLILTLSFAAFACSADEAPTAPETTTSQPLAAPDFASASNTWTARAPMPTPRWQLTGAAANDAGGKSVFYAIGGVRAQTGQAVATVEAYNVATNTWTTKAPMPAARYATNGVGRIGTKLYVAGGWGADNSPHAELFVYDVSSNTWTRKANMPRATASGVTGVINGKLYVLPGVCSACGEDRNAAIRQLYRYDPVTDKWETGFPLSPHVHQQGATAVIFGKLYVAGGNQFPVDDVTAFLDVYDPATNRWTTKASMTYGRYGLAGSFLDDKLYVTGGATLNAQYGVRAVQAYDPLTNRWTDKASLLLRRRYHASGRVTLNGKSLLLVVGGQASSASTSSSTELYTP